MRYDVVLSEASVARELDEAETRLRASGDLRHDGWRPTPVCDVSHWVRDVGDHRFVYLKDARHDRVVGLFSFQRIVLGRGGLPVQLPHGKVRRGYRGLGLARWVYRDTLRRGACLLSGARQSLAASYVWSSLAREFEHGYLWVERRSARFLGATLSEAEVAQLEVRRLLHPAAVAPEVELSVPERRYRPR